ncbi:hypothetical protein [Pseudooceanicola spongiae]|uniref:Uncharacterized protein n=1 Tax=Pseudooceanicola spongiae TaxID=2613965 RepID=A0A7L9WQQ8_9RHOB|nr:hypothetical protein [Pseudooceanicola spongiae]QOL81868.1 hypothetical protein F3W81_14175 [Pseudooceanicola spongiae]
MNTPLREDAFHVDRISAPLSKSPLSQEMKLDAACELLNLGMTQFLTLSNKDLRKEDINPSLAPKSFTAKSDIFSSCEKNARVSGLRFNSKAPYIPRSEFSRRQSSSFSQPDPNDPWHFEKIDCIATSPNWDRLDGIRKWKGRNKKKGTTIYFEIDDPKFWKLVREEKIKASSHDRILSQAAFKLSGGNRTRIIFLRVLKYNDLKVSSAATLEELTSDLYKRFGDVSTSSASKLPLFPDQASI